jgi:hypothetical protein
MKTRLPDRVTYANVVSTLCLFLLLGGGAALAAGKLAKNSVGTKQIKNRSITTAKIKNRAVTGAKIKDGTISGSKIDLITLGQVPSAAHADAINGMHLAKIYFASGPNAGKTSAFNADGLTLFAECSANELEFTATTSIANTEIYASGNYISEFAGEYNESFTIGDVQTVGKDIGNKKQDADQGQLVYSTIEGAVVTAQFSLKEIPGTGCFVSGTAQYS